jgi:hypothetical protein
MRLRYVLALVIGCAARPPDVVQAPSTEGSGGAVVIPPPKATAAATGRFEEALRAWTGPSRCDDFDYFPHGGIRSFWCHRPESITIAKLRAAAGTEIFLSGPHLHDELRVEERYDFGHYDPAFVRWLVDELAPSPRGSALQIATQREFDMAARPLVEVFWKTHLKIERDRACFANEKALYEAAMKARRLPADYYERWFFFMNPYFCDRAARGLKDDQFYFDNAFDGGVDGNVTKTVVGFWLRRAIDGTIGTFAEGLKNVVTSYGPEILALGSRAPDTAAIERALDGAVVASASCKDPQATSSTSAVEVVFGPDGAVQRARLMLRGTASACFEGKFSGLRVPPFDGEALRFARPVQLK